MNTTIDNNDLINGLINVLADSITKKVMDRIAEVIDKKIADEVEKSIENFDFSDVVQENIDEQSIISSVEDNIDVDDKVSTEVAEQIESYDFSDIIRAEIAKLTFEVKVSK